MAKRRGSSIMPEQSVQRFQNKLHNIARIIAIVGACLLLIMVLITVADVVMRRVLNAPLRGSLELTETLLGISVFTALAFCASEEGGHVEVDILINRLPLQLRKMIASWMYFLSAAMLGLISWQLVLYAIRVFEMHEVSAILAISLWPFISIAALCMAFLALVFLVHSIINFVEIKTK
jgi:TRAP-type C4-dicarboxylate transport system permease small subunit